MRKQLFSVLVAAACLTAITSCGDNIDNSATSTPIDSTNINGTAPVEYGAKSDTGNMLPAESDGLKANTDSQEVKKQP